MRWTTSEMVVPTIPPPRDVSLEVTAVSQLGLKRPFVWYEGYLPHRLGGYAVPYRPWHYLSGLFEFHARFQERPATLQHTVILIFVT